MQSKHLLAAAIVLAAGSSALQAETVFGLTDATSPSLVHFDSATPGTVTTVGSITGVVSGHALRGIDFRPANGQLCAVSAATTNAALAQMYTINQTTGVATAFGSGFALAGNSSPRVSLDFNPVVDRLRIVTGSGQNHRANPNDGSLVLRDTDLSNPALQISGIAYTNNVPGATSTSLYAYDYITDNLGLIGGRGGAAQTAPMAVCTRWLPRSVASVSVPRWALTSVVRRVRSTWPSMTWPAPTTRASSSA